jgi:hypothetical protein
MGVKRRERHYGVFSQFVLRQIELATAAASNPDAVRILLTDRPQTVLVFQSATPPAKPDPLHQTSKREYCARNRTGDKFRFGLRDDAVVSYYVRTYTLSLLF